MYGVKTNFWNKFHDCTYMLLPDNCNLKFRNSPNLASYSQGPLYFKKLKLPPKFTLILPYSLHIKFGLGPWVPTPQF
jgi:hypothetical protein